MYTLYHGLDQIYHPGLEITVFSKISHHEYDVHVWRHCLIGIFTFDAPHVKLGKVENKMAVYPTSDILIRFA